MLVVVLRSSIEGRASVGLLRLSVHLAWLGHVSGAHLRSNSVLRRRNRLLIVVVVVLASVESI